MESLQCMINFQPSMLLPESKDNTYFAWSQTVSEIENCPASDQDETSSQKRKYYLSNGSFYYCCFVIKCKTIKTFILAREEYKVEFQHRVLPSQCNWFHRNLYKSSKITATIEKNTPKEYFFWHLIPGVYRLINLCLFTFFPQSQIK